MSYREKSVRCLHHGGFHDMVYSDWGVEDAETTIVCVHGLTRNGKDFDRLASALAEDGFRVLAPDIVGRGRSGLLGLDATYDIPQYIADINTMLTAENLSQVDWIGTSMGGLIGMGLAAIPGHPIRRMLINDVGPLVPKEALKRIGDYVGVAWRFEDLDQAVEHVKLAYAPFGLTTDQDWRYLAHLSLAPAEEGGWRKAYDLRIAEPFTDVEIEDIDLWPLWDQLNLPILVLRGAESDLLSAQTAKAMTERGPKATVIEIDGCGHAPSLIEQDQIDLVRRWAREAL